MPTRTLVSFDWAMKKLLRSKANFDTLKTLESKSNQEEQQGRFNRFRLSDNLGENFEQPPQWSIVEQDVKRNKTCRVYARRCSNGHDI